MVNKISKLTLQKVNTHTYTHVHIHVHVYIFHICVQMNI